MASRKDVPGCWTSGGFTCCWSEIFQVLGALHGESVGTLNPKSPGMGFGLAAILSSSTLAAIRFQSFRVFGFGFRVSGLGFRVSALGFQGS